MIPANIKRRSTMTIAMPAIADSNSLSESGCRPKAY
jgi:hypothetical protein